MPISPRFAVIKPNGAKSPATTHIYSSSSNSESASGTGSSESSNSSGSESSSEVGSPDQMETPTVPPVLKGYIYKIYFNI